MLICESGNIFKDVIRLLVRFPFQAEYCEYIPASMLVETPFRSVPIVNG